MNKNGVKAIKIKILNYIYNVSKQPVLLKDLLIVNKQLLNGLKPEEARLGFGLNLFRAYKIYCIIVIAILTPILALMHIELSMLNIHVSIFVSVFFTSMVFMGFGFFKDYTRNQITKNIVSKSWENHFPFFPYEKYSRKVDIFFEQAMKEEISRRDLERYILDKLSK